MKDKAEPIQEDVSVEANDETKVAEAEQETKEALTPREEAMNKIAEARKAEVQKDIENAGLSTPDEPELEQEQDESEIEASGEDNARLDDTSKGDAALDPLSKSLGVYQNDSGESVIKMKVNGMEREVPVDQVKAMLQKDIAGDIKLRQATELERELQAKYSRQSQEQQPLSDQNQPSEDVEQGQIKQLWLDYHEELLNGDPDRAKEMAEELGDLMERRQSSTQPQIDESFLINRATENTIQYLSQQELEKDRQTGLSKANKEYAHIMGDNYLRDIADRFSGEVYAEDPDLSPSENIIEACKRTEQWLEKSTG
jgi:hypothetical protein